MESNVEGESRGGIGCFATYRPPVPLDIFSAPSSGLGGANDELCPTDGFSYNYNGQPIPPAALKVLLATKLASKSSATAADVDAGRVTGLVFVSERECGLETLHVALRFVAEGEVKVFSLADIYGAGDFSGSRMEDSGCFGGGYAVGSKAVDHYLVYVSTKAPVQVRRCPWTVVYRANLGTGKTERLTTPHQFDLNPSVSKSGKKVAVANFAGNTWTGEIEKLKTNIYMMNLDKASNGGRLDRVLVVEDGGWPSWGGDDFIFFHRKEGDNWSVFRINVNDENKEVIRVTPKGISAVTPAAISESEVAVATIREKSGFEDERTEAQYRHIEVFQLRPAPEQPVAVPITRVGPNPKADHYNPFVLDRGGRIGYHRCRISEGELLKNGEGDMVARRGFDKLQSPRHDIGLFRVSGVFPTVSGDGSMLAFVDNEFKSILVASKDGLRCVYTVDEANEEDRVFAPMWNKNAQFCGGTLYFCVGKAFSADTELQIWRVAQLSTTGGEVVPKKLTKGSFNNAFPSSNREGNRFVFRSTRDHHAGGPRHKNLYIMEDANMGEFGRGTKRVTCLTQGPWTDTHCQWSPNGDWIVFSSTRYKPATAAPLDNDLDPGYFTVCLVRPDDPTVVRPIVETNTTAVHRPLPTVVRVIGSRLHDMAGHVNHPVFSPDGDAIAFTSDLAAVSADPISLPLFLHSVRPYGDIFVVDIDRDDIHKNSDIQEFHRITHSRYEYSTPAWTRYAATSPMAHWTKFVEEDKSRKTEASYSPMCPHMHRSGAEGWQMTGHLVLPKRCC